MKESFVYPGFEHENNDNNNNSHEFDLRTDFSQFLEEAKRHSSHDNETPRTEIVKNQQIFINQEAKKSKKSWKSILFPFRRWSSSNKSKQHSKETSRNTNVTNPKPRGSVSGPIYGSKGSWAASSGRFQNRLLGSGPLTGMFQSKKKEEIEVAYVSLDKLTKPLNDAKVYGPVYLVS